MPLAAMSREQVRDVDRRAIDEYGLPGMVLMENAGRGTAELIISLGIDGPVMICAGKGNNGGDGFVVARHLENRGYSVQVLLFTEPESLKGDAATNYRVLHKAGTPLQVVNEKNLDVIAQQLSSAAWIVDALLGTGTRGEIREPFRSVIPLINQSGQQILAVDLPSGLDCNTGMPLGECIRADQTATFVARKLGFENPHSVKWTGEVHVIDIGVPIALFSASQNE